jgi:type II secretory pathway pseudopilin PulG
MVATVIAIFALLVLPIFRNRVEQAKIAAAQADLVSMYKALTLEEADTGFYVRLEDLDNTAYDTSKNPPAIGVTTEVPIFTYGQNGDLRLNKSLTFNEWGQLAGPRTSPKWKGPYITFQNYVSYYDVLNDAKFNPMLRSKNTDYNYRPIQDVPQTGGAAPGDPRGVANNLFDSADQARPNRIPVDPWGNPYLFYPPDSNSGPGTETGYGQSWLVSMGPDGLPGDTATNPSNNPNAYLRSYVDASSGVTPLGTGDDLVVRF